MADQCGCFQGVLSLIILVFHNVLPFSFVLMVAVVYEVTVCRFQSKWKLGMKTLNPIISVHILKQIILALLNFTGGYKNKKFQVSDVLLHSCSIITASLKIVSQYNVNFVRCMKHTCWPPL